MYEKKQEKQNKNNEDSEGAADLLHHFNMTIVSVTRPSGREPRENTSEMCSKSLQSVSAQNIQEIFALAVAWLTTNAAQHPKCQLKLKDTPTFFNLQ